MGKNRLLCLKIAKSGIRKNANNMVILVKQSTSKYDSMGDSIWLAGQGKYASTTNIVWCRIILL